MVQQNNQAPAPEPASYSIVGAWHVNAEGAPFVPHVALFHADGTMLIHNPDVASDGSDSLGVGAWRGVRDSPNSILGAFEEIAVNVKGILSHSMPTN